MKDNKIGVNMKEYTGTVAESWTPTYENVTREFITETMYKILFSEELPNFKFDFREDEAIDFIENTLKSYSEQYEFEKKKAQKVLQTIKRKSDGNTKEPVMIVNDYKKFFELLRQLYEKQIELYFARTGMSGFSRYEKNSFFEEIWLRATPDDFNNPEEFLKKQVSMVNDTTFEKYNEETCLGKIEFLDDNILCVKNGIARTWDENSKEFKIIIYDKNHYDNKELFVRPNYTLPVIRYGVYEKNGQKVCFIGSIQDKVYFGESDSLEKEINKKRYKANEGVSKEDTYRVEPKHLLSLSIFVNLLHKEGITEIEVPGLYVLDYDYHIKRNKNILEDFKKNWTEEAIEKYPDIYIRELNYFENTYNKEDLISEIKTERLLLTFKRLLHHYQNGNITSYPGELDCFMHLSIPVVNTKDDINGSIFKELYQLDKKIDPELEL